VPTGDPNCSPHICNARNILLATDGSAGGVEDGGGDFDNERDGGFEGGGEDDDEEGGMVEINNNSFSFSADKQEQLTVDDDDGGQLDVAAVVAFGRWASDGDQVSVLALSDEKRRVGEASSYKEVREGGAEGNCAFSMPFKIAAKEVFSSYGRQG
jgi:hypothetical protein